MQLFVGPDSHGGELVAASRLAWDRIERSVVPKPFDYSNIEFLDGLSGSGAKAEAIANIGKDFPSGETCVIVLGERFFRLSPIDQDLTLLHECIHLRFMCGDLRVKTLETKALRKKYRSEGVPEPQLTLAFYLWNFLDEAVAERFLRQTYKEWADARASYYLKMRLEQANILEVFQGRLRGYAAFHEVLRCELGVEMLDGRPNDRAKAEKLVATYQNEVQRALPVDARNELFGLREELLRAEVSTRSYSAGAYQTIFNLVRSCSNE